MNGEAFLAFEDADLSAFLSIPALGSGNLRIEERDRAIFADFGAGARKERDGI